MLDGVRSRVGDLSRAQAVVGILVALVVLVGVAVALGVIGTPGVTDVQNRFGGVDDETTTVVTDLTVRNPNPVGVRLGGVTVNYTVDLNEVRIARGTKEGVNVTTGNSTLTFRTGMSNERIPEWWVAHIRDGERSDLVVHAEARSSTLGRTIPFNPVDREVSTDILSAFNSSETRPVNANRPVVSDPVLYVNETSAQWGTVSEAETPIEMAMVVYNPKAVPYTVTGIGYEITMNDVAVGSGENDRTYAIPPGATRTIRTTTAIDNPSLDEWWVSHLQRNQVTDLRIDFYTRIELPSGNEIRVPLDELTYTETVETDIFGNKDESAAGGAGNESDGSDVVPTTDGSGTVLTTGEGTGTAIAGTPLATPTEPGTETVTSTESGTTTATTDGTATATETEDGLL